ncbi:cholinesterase [Coprinopsis sp. MPI-PUGE-AT-0042]|nr:cholinesterase [Coprinopsis sp. MPI-PUGE-AT-0042]
MTLSKLFLSISQLAALTLAATSPSALGSDLTVLYQNDLDYRTTADRSSTVLLHKELPYRAAVEACQSIGESLLEPGGKPIEKDLPYLLGYTHRVNDLKTRHFWSSQKRSGPRKCLAISLQGETVEMGCETRLPALCSQTTQLTRSNPESALDPRYHVEVNSAGLTFTGTRDKRSFRFLGIPYANPTQRFAYSDLYSGAGRLSALSFGQPCLAIDLNGSEDCLFLNIYTPYLPTDDRKPKVLKPVMFFIHGGGFVGGASSQPQFDGGNMASRSDVVFVGINYRLGPLGFLALNDGVTNGNFGIADQITALRWVRKHISAFGGDPNRVTILGNSAGAGSVRALLGAKPAFGLFHAGIAQSNLGGFGYGKAYSKYYTIQEQFTEFASPVIQEVGCEAAANVLQCLRQAPADRLIKAPTAPRYIVVDGKYITSDELQLGGKGQAANAHVMFGWTKDDGADFLGDNLPRANDTALGILTTAGLDSEVAQRALESGLFPLPSGSNATWNLHNQTSRISTDGQFRCIDQATLIAGAQKKVFPSVYGYQFEHTSRGWDRIPGTCWPPSSPKYPSGDPNLPYFKCHDGDLAFILGNFGEGTPFREEKDLIMAQAVVDFWGSFARTFDPNPTQWFLEARGYQNTISTLKKSGKWDPVTTSNSRPLRLMNVPFTSSPWVEKDQCKILGYPLDYYL